MKGIIIKQPFAREIIKRNKKTEYRKYKLSDNYLHKPIYLLSKGRVLGMIILALKSQHKNDFRYKIIVDNIFNPSLKYKHPQGAQLYVKNVKLVVKT